MKGRLACIVGLGCALAGVLRGDESAAARVTFLPYAQVIGGTCHATPGTNIVIASATAVGTSGGGTVITADVGGVFPTSPEVEACADNGGGCGSGQYYPLHVTSATTSQIVAGAPAMPAGTYGLLISSPSCNATYTRGVLPVVAVRDFAAVCGTNLDVWYRSDTGVTCGGGACANAGLVDAWADKSGNGHPLGAAGSARGTYASTSTMVPPGMANYPSVIVDGVSNLLTNTSLPFANTTDVAIWLVGKQYSTGANKNWACVTDSGTHTFCLGTNTSATVPALTDSGLATVFSTSVLSTGFQVFGESHNTGSGLTTKVTDRNATAVTGSNGATISAGTGKISLGGNSTTPSGNIELLEFAMCHYNPSAQDLLDIATYINHEYFNYSPGYLAATDTSNASLGFRVLGPGGSGAFLNGMTVKFGGDLAGVIPDQTATIRSTAVAEIPMPGTTIGTGKLDHPIALVNPDGGETQIPAGLTTYSDLTTSPTVALQDNGVSGWYEVQGTQGTAHTPGFAYTASGGLTSDIFDQSLSKNDVAGTGTQKPALTLGDANYGGANSIAFDGVANELLASAFNTYLTSPGIDVDCVARFDSDTTLQRWMVDYANTTVSLEDFTGHARNVAGGNVATHGSVIAGSTHEIFIDHPAGASPTLLVNVDNGGSPVTLATAGSALTDGLAFALGGKTTAANFYKGSLSCCVVTRRSMTSTEHANVKTYLHNHCGGP